jgi:membrane fusion protein (multidrug efflux system)
MQQNIKNKFIKTGALLVTVYASVFLPSCSLKADPDKKESPPSVSTIIIKTDSATTSRQYASILEGVANIEIRPQVGGYLEKIFVDEGAHVSKGQPLFLIDDKPFTEQLNQSTAALGTAIANADKAKIEVARLEKLVAGKVISQVQLDNAKAALNAENSNIAQAKAAQKLAIINKGYTLIKAPVSGYIGSLPYKVGSLISYTEPLPLTVLSDIHQMYAYFSMSENEFLEFTKRYPGKSMEEKIKQVPSVSLMLADNSVYGEMGRIDIVKGQFDETTAAITFRAIFPNAGSLLRSGNTGKVIIPFKYSDVIRIPQAATFQMQNKIMAYVIGKNDTLKSMSLKVLDKDDQYYIVSEGVKPGDNMVVKGTDRLREGMVVTPNKNN